MNALDNANIPDETRLGLTSFAFPKAQSSRAGVSVDYASDASKQWYVLRIKYGKVQQVADALIECGEYVYMAKVWKDIHDKETGRKIRKLLPFMNILFAYVTHDAAEKYVKESALSLYTTYYYNHFDINAYGKNTPLTVRQKEMVPFILATAIQDEHVMEVDIDACKFICDEPVRVTGGPFEGLTGRYVRIARQKRVMVYIEGLNSGIVTAYIPSYLIEKID